MRNASLVVLALCAQFLLSGLTFTVTQVNLDQPGAMERISVLVDSFSYQVTVRMIKNPAVIEKAK